MSMKNELVKKIWPFYLRLNKLYCIYLYYVAGLDYAFSGPDFDLDIDLDLGEC